jgi:hypothetical protein
MCAQKKKKGRIRGSGGGVRSCFRAEAAAAAAAAEAVWW